MTIKFTEACRFIAVVNAKMLQTLFFFPNKDRKSFVFI